MHPSHLSFEEKSIFILTILTIIILFSFTVLANSCVDITTVFQNFYINLVFLPKKIRFVNDPVLMVFQHDLNANSKKKINYNYNFFIFDTPGFSEITVDASPWDAVMNFPPYDKYLNQCKYPDCTHIGEPDCIIKELVDAGKLSKDRHLRYEEIFNEIKKDFAQLRSLFYQSTLTPFPKMKLPIKYMATLAIAYTTMPIITIVISVLTATA